MSPSPLPPDSPVEWREDGLPRSRLYGDVYFSSEDGLAETRAVFLEGCGLPGAWAGRRRFVVGELGFGSGLNIAALLDLWRRERPAGGQLHIFSLEAHPMAREDAARALGCWPELAEAAGALLAAWPGRARGVHRVELPAFGAVLDLAVMDAAEALASWTGQADAWFLDGFAPATNPAMWSEDILQRVAARSAPGARAATFTVAGAVRRGLAAAGFEVEKRPGFGRKRERLEARLPGAGVDEASPGRVAVVGAGIGGAAMVRALSAVGLEAICLDPRGRGGGASGNAAALMTPRLDAGDGPAAPLYAQAFGRAVRLYEDLPDAIIARGARHLGKGPRDPERFARIAEGGLFEPGALAAEEGSLVISEALVLDPAVLLRTWIGDVEPHAVTGLQRDGAGWRLELDGGAGERLVDVVVICAGHRTGDLVPEPPLRPVRGQVSLAEGVDPGEATSFGGYVIPTRDGLLFGATHQRDRTDEAAFGEDHDLNRRTLAEGRPDLALAIEGRTLEGRAAVRASTPDHLPIAGAVDGQPGLFVLGGFGGRGFCLAPLLAEHVAALVGGCPSPLPATLAETVDPGRFARRAARRAR
ncbi:MAG: tRNA (5-methylaminomethyl-2-thiouridine)(34)-methyltransferase MnmD [Caulobacter sp.]